MRGLLCFALLTLAVAGCATTRAETLAPEPLRVPPVPPRVIVPDIEEVSMTVDPDDAARTSQRTDAPPKPPEKPVEPPKAGTAQDPPKIEEAPRVRTPQMANDEQAERSVRGIMGRAQGLLSNVDYQALSPAARQQYDTARRFIAQADSALKIRNYVFARNLADKAETLARQLGK